MKNWFKETIDLGDRTITVTHHTTLWSMLYFNNIKPLLQPLANIGYQYKKKAFIAVFYSLFAWVQGLFETEVMLDLLITPSGLVEGLAIIVAVDFLAGWYRAVTDSRIKFEIKKFSKTFHKIVFYSFAIVVITIGANMFPKALGWLQYGAFLVATASEIHSVLRHAKLTAWWHIGWEVYRNKEKLAEIDFSKIKQRVDERSAIEFAESQAYYFGNEQIEEVRLKESESNNRPE